MKTIRLLAIIEASSLTGPAKNLLEFCARAQERTREQTAPRIEPFLVTFRRAQNAASDEFLDAARAARVPVEIVSQQSRFDRNTLASLRQIVAAVNPDILQTHAIKSHFLIRSSGLWRERPWLAFHHGYTLTDTKMLAYNLLDLWSLRAPARIVTVSNAFARQLTCCGISPTRITVLHNAVGADWIERSGLTRASARKLLGIPADDRMVLAVGRLSREKAFGDLITAVGELKKAHPALHPRLFIAGEGPERHALEARIAVLGLSERVTLTGAVRELALYYAAADLLAISSIQEGSPNALLEAMAARLPVVATSVGGIPEIAEHDESAILVPPRQPKKMAQAMAQVLSDPARAAGIAARAHEVIVNRFDPEMRAAKLAAIYAAVLATG